jgi:hypothetical protein
MHPLRIDEITAEIAVAERELNEPDQRAFRLWEHIRVPPQRWHTSQYPGVPEAWVVAVLGSRCMNYNEVECGWGWGCYTEFGSIRDFHWQQDEIYHVVFQTEYALLRAESANLSLELICGTGHSASMEYQLTARQAAQI